MKTITLQETRQGCEICEKEPRYNVIFRGKVYCQLYFNMTGYVGYLPAPFNNGTTIRFDIGERPISVFRKEIAKLNKEWKSYQG